MRGPMSLLALAMALVLVGCSLEQKEMALGVWSNSHQGKLLDITPHGFYADVWIESEVKVMSWEIPEDDHFTFRPLCTAVPEGEQEVLFRFDEGGLEFPGEGARYVRFIKEKPNKSPVPELVGLWFRETLTRKKEFIEFTPWSTAIWNRWDGKPGSETLSAGWSNYFPSDRRSKLLFAGVENGELFRHPVSYEVTATKLTLRFPKPIGKREYIKTSSTTELLSASKGTTR